VLAAAQRALADLPPERRPAARFVSVDPQRDTPERLGAYLASFPADIRGLTGEEAAIAAFTRALGIAYARVDGGDGAYTMDHTAALLLLDPRAQLVAVFTPPHDARALAAELRAISKRRR
jgi:protein SCO1/2